MKNFYLIFSITISFVFGSCVTQKEPPITYGVSATGVQLTQPDTLDNLKIDSLLKVDRLPSVNKWTSSSFVDDETQVRSTYRTLYDKKTNTIYTLKFLRDGRCVLVKKIIKTH